MSLIPVLPEFNLVIEQEETTFPQDWLFDFDKGEFVISSSGSVVLADGYTSWKNWCIKQIFITRFACLGYSWDIGIDEAYINSLNADEAQRTAIERSITEALMMHPKTKQVTSIAFETVGDAVYITFDVYPVEGAKFEYRKELRSLPWT